MTRVKDAIEAVDRRLAAIRTASTDIADEGLAGVGNIALTCSGTDIPGAVLEQLLVADVSDIMRRASGSVCEHGERCRVNCVVEAYVRGVFLRAFWLGYEFGKDEPF